jgi:hypothetical protein
MNKMTTVINLAFSELMRFRVNHGYYREGYCPNIAIVPNAQTKKLLALLDWHFQAVPTGFNLFSKDRPDRVWPTNGKSVELELLLITDSRDFEAVTEFPTSTLPPSASNIHTYSYASGAWTYSTEQGNTSPFVKGLAAQIRISIDLSPETLQTITLPFTATGIQYTYYIVTGPNYSSPFQISEGAQVISSNGTFRAEDLQKIQARFPGKIVQAFKIERQLQRKFPNWYLVQDDGFGNWEPISDLPALPRPKVGAVPYMILDYSALLK